MDSLVLLEAEFMVTSCLESMNCVENLDKKKKDVIGTEPRISEKLNRFPPFRSGDKGVLAFDSHTVQDFLMDLVGYNYQIHGT